MSGRNVFETEIYAHKIVYWWHDEADRELDEVDEEQISRLLKGGFVEGELNQYDHELEQVATGWWRIEEKD